MSSSDFILGRSSLYFINFHFRTELARFHSRVFAVSDPGFDPHGSSPDPGGSVLPDAERDGAQLPGALHQRGAGRPAGPARAGATRRLRCTTPPPLQYQLVRAAG